MADRITIGDTLAMGRDAVRYLGLFRAAHYLISTREERSAGVRMHPLDWQDSERPGEPTRRWEDFN